MSTNAENYVWYLSSLTIIRVSAQSGDDQLSVVEQRARKGWSPPLHLHRTQDEIFQVLEGEFRIQLADQEHHLKAGEFLLIPKGVPHTSIVESSEGRWVTIMAGADFENFVRAAARPAERIEIPPYGEDTSPENMVALTMTAAQFGLEVVGPALR